MSEREHTLSTITTTEWRSAAGGLQERHSAAYCSCGIQPFCGRTRAGALAALEAHISVESE